MRLIINFCSVVIVSFFPAFTHAHPVMGEAHYLGNEGVMISSGDQKILFDPLYFKGFGTYQMVPDDLRTALIAGEPPYDQIDVIFISHMHEDHFDPKTIAEYMDRHPNARLVAPAQAVDQIRERTTELALLDRITSIALERGDAPVQVELGEVTAEIVRIPHAGWPSRAEISNLVTRVTFSEGLTIMHLGDADMALDHYTPHGDHWVARETDTAFPPYWFQITQEGHTLLTSYLNTNHSIGLHVPVQLPPPLEALGVDYFHTPGESRQIGEISATNE